MRAARSFDEVRVLQLVDRNVDVDGQRQPCVLPRLGLGEGGVEHPAAELDVEADVFDDRQELVRIEQAALGVLPADEASAPITLPARMSTLAGRRAGTRCRRLRSMMRRDSLRLSSTFSCSGSGHGSDCARPFWPRTWRGRRGG